LRSLPLHHSQKEVETSEDFSIFAYYLCIERDFISEILSNGTDIEVLEPQSLRDNISTTIRNMLGKYE
jgi:predicted DNA-binding transcriptional regulator YafY